MITKDKKVQRDIIIKLLEAIEIFGEIIDGKVTTPVHHYLFDVDKNLKLLNETRKEIFYSVTQKFLYTIKRARPDLETLVSFLTTQVTKSTEEDWGKVKRGLTFVKETINDKPIIGTSSLDNFFTWIDTAYAVNNDM